MLNNSAVAMLNKIVDNIEQWWQQSIVQPCFITITTTRSFSLRNPVFLLEDKGGKHEVFCALTS